MISDSPVVMIIVVSLQANSVSLVESKQDIIVQEVCHYEGFVMLRMCYTYVCISNHIIRISHRVSR